MGLDDGACLKMPFSLEKSAAAIVGLGAFNPAILSPDWLEKHNLIGAGDAHTARAFPSLVISHKVTNFETDWFALQVLEDRFTLSSRGPVTPMVRDLAAGILSLVPHTPISAVGMNFIGHFKASKLEEYHRVGDTLAPKDIWNDLFPGPDRNSGLANLTIKIQPCGRDQSPQSGDEKNVTVAPDPTSRGVIVLSLNDHRTLPNEARLGYSAAQHFSLTIDNEWENSRNEAFLMFGKLLAAAGNC